MNSEIKIKELNSQYHISDLTDSEFSEYGLTYPQYNLTELQTFLKDNIKIPPSKQDNIYVPSNPKIENIPVIQQISQDLFAGLPIEVGECSGHNSALTALEYHQGSEVNIFATDVVMALGKRYQMKNQQFNAEKDAKLFFIPANTVVEFYSDTLHYSPCEVYSSGFKFIVMLIKGSNQPLPANYHKNNPLVMKTNKFQIAHKSRTDKINQGELPGLIGELIKIKPII